MSPKLKKSLAVQGSILAIAGLISKMIGFLYRIPMANIVGNEGNGLYSVSFGIYGIALTLSSYSCPLAVSKLMSARFAQGKPKNAHKVFRIAQLFAVSTGFIAWMVLLFGAEYLADLYRKPGLEHPLRVLAPTTFVVAVLGTGRGYFQGHRNMVPTAVSQVIEQIVNAVVSIVAAAYFVLLSGGTIKGFVGSVRPVENLPEDFTPAAGGAAGGTLGTLAGALTALIFISILFIVGKKAGKAEVSGPDIADEDEKILWKALLLTIFPVILSQSVYQLGYTLDDLIFGNIMVRMKGFSERETTILQGIFNTQYNQMINLPAALATALASAAIPTIAGAFARKDTSEVLRKTDQVFRYNLLIAIPSTVGLAVLAEPIMKVLFPALGDYLPVAVLLLQTGSLAVVFYTLSTLSAAVLQGCDHMWTPVRHAAISLAIHAVLLSALLIFTDMDVLALIIGNVTFPLVTSVMNIRSLKKLNGYSFDMKNVVLRPTGAAAIMGAFALAVLLLLEYMGVGRIMQLAVPIIAAVVVYSVLIPVLHIMTPEEMASFPVIGKLLRKLMKTGK